MRIALELNGTECQVLITCLDDKIRKTEECRDTHEECWSYADEVVLGYEMKLRDKIQEFQDIQEHLSVERKD